MRVLVNGEEHEVETGLTVTGLLEAIGASRDRIAVEVNREIVPRSRHGEHVLADGDRVEIVTMVGGG